MGLQKRNDRTRRKRDNIHMHIMPHIAGIHKARRRPGPIRIRHLNRRHIPLVGDNHLRRIHTLNRLIRLAHPVEAQRLAAAIVQSPVTPRRQIRIPAFTQHMGLRPNPQLRLPLNHKQHRLRSCIALRPVRPTPRRNLHDVLREGLRKPAHGPRQNPQTRALPERQLAGDNVAHAPFGNDRIGIGEHRPIRQQLFLPRMPAFGCVILA